MDTAASAAIHCERSRGSPARGAKGTARESRSPGRALLAPAGLHAELRCSFHPNPSCQTGPARQRKGALPHPLHRGGRAPCCRRLRRPGLKQPYAGAPPTEFPKSRLPIRVSPHEYATPSPSPRHGARPVFAAHGSATPCMLCEGACSGRRVEKVWTCIVVPGRSVLSPRGRKTKKEPRSSGLLAKTRRAPDLWSAMACREGRDSRWPPV